MPNRIPTPGVKAPAVRKSPGATSAPKPTAAPKKTVSPYKGMSYDQMLKATKGDVTKVPGYDKGKRTR